MAGRTDRNSIFRNEQIVTRIWDLPRNSKEPISEALSLFLDLARGIAAVLVLFFHVRSALLVPFANLKVHGAGAASFFLMTTFGHDAVIVFFVLSGFLVGGSVLRIRFGSREDIAKYCIDRFVRIFPVLAAATVCSVGLLAVEYYSLGRVGCSVEPSTVLGNILALQNFVVKPLCNNLPLWSISSEVFYYIAFPVLVAIFAGSRSYVSAALLLAVIGLSIVSLTLTPLDDRNSLLYFPIWLLGAVTATIMNRWSANLWGAAVLLVVALAFGRMEVSKDWFWWRDFALAAAFCIVLMSIGGRKIGASIVERCLIVVSRWLSTISFSLYVVHYPLIVLYTRYLQRGVEGEYRRDVLSASVIFEFLLLVLLSLLIATAFSFVFERSRYWMREKLEARYRRPASA
ncbi:peptidoglycan/LPS O-acetylase OafA/YrhL [Bradyrhizobium sp. USDA 4449]